MPTDTAADLTRGQLNLLLYLETCAVDQAGRVDSRRVNAEECTWMLEWSNSGFITLARICHADVIQSKCNCVRLSDAAWELAHRERRARAERMWAGRNYRTTEEKRNAQD